MANDEFRDKLRAEWLIDRLLKAKRTRDEIDSKIASLCSELRGLVEKWGWKWEE